MERRIGQTSVTSPSPSKTAAGEKTDPGGPKGMGGEAGAAVCEVTDGARSGAVHRH